MEVDLQTIEGPPIFDEVPAIVHDRVPDGLEIRKNAYGHGVFATKAFKAREPIYTARWLNIPDRKGKISLRLHTGQQFELDTDTHAVLFDETAGRLSLYAFDSFFNHSCAPNVFSPDVPEDWAQQRYTLYAARDIAPGEELVCDYLLFEWDSKETPIEQCLCGAPRCVGRMAGFKFASTEAQIARAPFVANNVLECFTAELGPRAVVLGDLAPAPQTVRVEVDMDPSSGVVRRRVFAARDFGPGDEVTRSVALRVPENGVVILRAAGEQRIMVPEPGTSTVQLCDWTQGMDDCDAAANCARVALDGLGASAIIATAAIARGDRIVVGARPADA